MRNGRIVLGILLVFIAGAVAIWGGEVVPSFDRYFIKSMEAEGYSHDQAFDRYFVKSMEAEGYSHDQALVALWYTHINAIKECLRALALKYGMDPEEVEKKFFEGGGDADECFVDLFAGNDKRRSEAHRRFVSILR